MSSKVDLTAFGNHLDAPLVALYWSEPALNVVCCPPGQFLGSLAVLPLWLGPRREALSVVPTESASRLGPGALWLRLVGYSWTGFSDQRLAPWSLWRRVHACPKCVTYDGGTFWSMHTVAGTVRGQLAMLGTQSR